MKHLIASFATLSVVAACAQAPDKVTAAYVSPSMYDKRTCSQLASERNEIVRQVNMLTDKQQKAANSDAVMTGVALLLFWPAAIMVGNSGDHAAALSQAKGNYDAITVKMRQSGCKV